MAKEQVRYEGGQTPFPFISLDNSGDNMLFTSGIAPWSGASGFEPVVSSYGLMTGGAITPVAGTNDEVSVAPLTASMAGVTGADADGVYAILTTSTVTGTAGAWRGDSTDPYRITSIIVDDDGDVDYIAGTKGAAFTESRGVAGGPPLIPDGAIELGQIRLSSATPAVITAAQILAVPNLHQERADYPIYDIDYARGGVRFVDTLPPIHKDALSNPIPKRIYARGATPLFVPIPRTSDWVPAETTYSINSTDTYDGPVGSTSSSLGQASFTAVLTDGITDALLEQRGRNIWFEFKPDRDRSAPRQLTQGVFGVTRTFPAGGGSRTAQCTITPMTESLDIKDSAP